MVEVLTESADTRQYVKRMRQRDPELDSCWGTICTPLELLAPKRCSASSSLYRPPRQNP